MLHALTRKYGPSVLGLCLLGLSLLARPAWSACPSTPTDLRDAVNAAHASFAAMDQGGFERARDEARTLVACLQEPITPVDAATLHRLEALDAFLRQDPDRTLLGFRAALALQPSFVLSDTVAPADSPLDQQYQAARALPDGGFLALEGPMGTILMVDGALSWSRPVTRPAVLQLLSMDGRVTWSGYLWPGSPLPPGLTPSTSVEGSTRLAERPDWAAPPDRTTRPLAVSAALCGVAATSLWAWSWASRSAWGDQMGTCLSGGCEDDPAAANAHLESLRIRTNVTSVASATLGVASVAVGTAAFVTWRW